MSRDSEDGGTADGEESTIPVTRIEFVPVNNDPQGGKTRRRPRYRDPDNPFLTWSGFGRRPEWLRAHIAQGRDLEEFRISDEGVNDGQG